MTDDDELIKRARRAYDRSTFDCPVESLQQAAPALFRAVDERDELRKSKEELRRACAEIIGADPDTWPAHGNSPLAIAACLALRSKRVVELESALWKEKFIGRLVEKGLDRTFAGETFEAGGYEDLTEDPVQCADEELSYWDDP